MRINAIAIIVFLMGVCSESLAGNSISKSDSVLTKEITFDNDGIRLSGTVFIPNDVDHPVPALVALHGSGDPSRDTITFEHLTERLPQMGMAVLVFDRRGGGDSEGDFQSADYYDLASDAISGMEKIADLEEIDPDRIGFWGISQGGWVGPLAATMTEKAAFCISVVGPGVTPSEQMVYTTKKILKNEGFSKDEIEEAVQTRTLIDEYFRGNVEHSELQQEMERVKNEEWYESAYLPSNGEIPEDITDTKWIHEFDYDPVPALKELETPTLYIYGDDDDFVPVAKSIEIMRENLTDDQPVSWYIINGAKHVINRESVNSDEPDPPFSFPEYHAVQESWLRSQLDI